MGVHSFCWFCHVAAQVGWVFDDKFGRGSHRKCEIKFHDFIHVTSFRGASGTIFFQFREVYQKCIEYKGKFFIQMREISKFWSKVLEILWLILGSSLKIREVSHVCDFSMIIPWSIIYFPWSFKVWHPTSLLSYMTILYKAKINILHK